MKISWFASVDNLGSSVKNMLSIVWECLLSWLFWRLSISGEISTTMGETERINVLRMCWYVRSHLYYYCKKRNYWRRSIWEIGMLKKLSGISQQRCWSILIPGRICRPECKSELTSWLLIRSRGRGQSLPHDFSMVNMSISLIWYCDNWPFNMFSKLIYD